MSDTPYRVGKTYGIHVYQGDTPVATFHSSDEARKFVDAMNARESLDDLGITPTIQETLKAVTGMALVNVSEYDRLKKRDTQAQDVIADCNRILNTMNWFPDQRDNRYNRGLASQARVVLSKFGELE